MGEPLMIKTDVLKRNPFPGIRPYTSAEDKLFFGRDEVTSDVVDLLQKNKFVALVGASASGKTSLIQAGVIPALLSQEKQEWIPVSICPGTRPVENLVRGFQKVFPKKLDEKVARLHLKKVGANLTALSQEQADYINVPVDGPYKPEHYRY